MWDIDASDVGGRHRRVVDVSAHMWLRFSTQPPPTRSLVSRTGDSIYLESDAIGTGEWRRVAGEGRTTVYAYALRYPNGNVQYFQLGAVKMFSEQTA